MNFKETDVVIQFKVLYTIISVCKKKITSEKLENVFIFFNYTKLKEFA